MKISKLQKLVDKICAGDFSSSDIGLLFLWLRPAVSKIPILLDLSNFVAHSEGRNQGASYNYINAYLKNVLDVSEKGGTIFGNSLFTRGEIISQLIVAMKSVGVNLNESEFASRQDHVVECILDLLDEIEIKTQDPRIIKCYLQSAGQKMSFCFQANIQGRFIRMSPGAVWQANLFD